MPRFTPPLHAKGIYHLTDSFPDISTSVYECVAIRSFKDYLDLGQSPLELVYLPNGLTDEDYQRDKALNANILTLSSNLKPTLLVPDTCLVKYPDLEYVNYSNLIVSAALGALPDGLSLELLKEQLAAVISDVIGVLPVVNVGAYGSDGVVSMAQHQLNEQARTAAITNRSTDRARLIEAQGRIVILEQRINDLQDLIAQQMAP